MPSNDRRAGIDVGLAKVPAGYASESASTRRKYHYRDYAMSHPGDIAEGKALSNNAHKRACTNCDTIDGKGDKARKHGNSITGGYVYRGKAAPSFNGVYVCDDYTSKRIWAITQTDRVLTSIQQIATHPQRISSFGAAEAGELYAVGYDGTIYHIDLKSATFDAKGTK